MAPRRLSTGRWQIARSTTSLHLYYLLMLIIYIGKPSRCLKKNRTLASPRRSARFQALRSSDASAIKSIQPIPLPEPITTSLVDLLQPSGQKQKQCSANEPALERPQKDVSSVIDSWQPLSGENLHIHNRITRATPPQDMGTLSLRTPDRSDHKRRASRQSIVSGRSIESTALSQRSSRLAAHYRWRTLRELRTSVCSELLPEAVTERINKVFGQEISDNRRGVLQYIAEHLQ